MELLAILVFLLRVVMVVAVFWHVTSLLKYHIAEENENQNQQIWQYLLSAAIIIVASIFEAVLATNSWLWVIVILTLLVNFVLFD